MNSGQNEGDEGGSQDPSISLREASTAGGGYLIGHSVGLSFFFLGRGSPLLMFFYHPVPSELPNSSIFMPPSNHVAEAYPRVLTPSILLDLIKVTPPFSPSRPP